MSSDSDSDSSSDYSPGLRLFGVRGSTVPRGGGADASPAPSSTAPAAASPGEGSGELAAELQEKVLRLEEMNSSPPPSLPPTTMQPPAATVGSLLDSSVDSSVDDAPAAAPAAAEEDRRAAPSEREAALTEQLAVAQAAASELQQQLSAKEDEGAAQRELHETQSRKALEILRAKDEELREQSERGADHASQVAALRSSLAELGDAKNRKEEELSQATRENAELRASLQKAAEQTGGVQAEAEAVVDDHGRQRERVQELEEQLRVASVRIASLEAEVRPAMAVANVRAHPANFSPRGRQVTRANEQRRAADAHMAELADRHRQQLAADEKIHLAALTEKRDDIARLEEQVKEQKLTIATLRALGEEAPGPKPISPSSHVSPQLGACWRLFLQLRALCFAGPTAQRHGRAAFSRCRGRYDRHPRAQPACRVRGRPGTAAASGDGAGGGGQSKPRGGHRCADQGGGTAAEDGC